jgi:hypothetical protein
LIDDFVPESDNVNPNNIHSNLSSRSELDSFYKSLKNSFNLTDEQIRSFEKKNKHAVSDWASFIQKSLEQN